MAASLKVYEVVKNSTFTYRDLEIRHEGVPFLYVSLETRILRPPIMSISTSPNGPVVAGARFPSFSTGVEVTIGDAANAQDENYVPVESVSMMGSSYSFPGVGTGHLYEWKRTHNKEYGSSMMSNSDFKLVDPANNNMVLAVYIKDSFTGGPSVAHIDFMVQLEDDLELQAITAILGIEEKLRRRRR